MFSITADRIPENLCRITRKIPWKGLKHPSRGIIFVGRPTRKDHTKLASRGEPSFHILRHPDRQETMLGWHASAVYSHSLHPETFSHSETGVLLSPTHWLKDILFLL